MEYAERRGVSVDAYVSLLGEMGPTLPRPYSDSVKNSRHSNMKELRVQHHGDSYRNLYAFDPRRRAILLIGGCKKGDDHWYDQNIPIADNLYDAHLREMNGKE